MTEIIDNALQFCVAVGCGIYSGVSAVKNKSSNWLLLTLFYMSFGMGHLYWVLYILFNKSTPQVFCVSELDWTAAIIFLAIRLAAGMPWEERKYRAGIAWLAPAFCTVMCIFFCIRGSYFENILMGTAMAFCGFYAIKGISFSKKEDKPCGKYISLAALCFFAAEYALWISSCYWVSDDLTNPYFLVDFFVLNPALVMPVLMQRKEDKLCHTI